MNVNLRKVHFGNKCTQNFHFYRPDLPKVYCGEPRRLWSYKCNARLPWGQLHAHYGLMFMAMLSLWQMAHQVFKSLSVMFYSPLFLLINLNVTADVSRSTFHSVCRSYIFRQEKLQLQEEQERARREMEEERLRLQQLKVWHIHRKSLSSKHVSIHTSLIHSAQIPCRTTPTC